MTGRVEHARAELALRRAYQEAFCRTDAGSVVLADILNDLGYYADDPAAVDPRAIAACNRILWKAGIYTRDPDGTASLVLEQVRGLTGRSTDADLVSLVTALEEEDKET